MILHTSCHPLFAWDGSHLPPWIQALRRSLQCDWWLLEIRYSDLRHKTHKQLIFNDLWLVDTHNTVIWLVFAHLAQSHREPVLRAGTGWSGWSWECTCDWSILNTVPFWDLIGLYLLGLATPELKPELKAEAPWVGVPAGDPPGLVDIRLPLLTLLKQGNT